MKNIFSTVPNFSAEGANVQPMNTLPTLVSKFVAIVAAYIAQFGTAIAAAEQVVMPGQGIAAAVFMALGELRWGLPKAAGLTIPGQSTIFVDLAEWGHGVVRNLRGQRTEGPASGKTYLFEGGHATTEQARTQICENLGINADDLVIVKFGSNAITAEELASDGKDRIAVEILEAGNAAGITAGDWESGRVLLAPAGLGALATLQFVALYRISGQWPQAVRTAAAAQGQPFELAELIPLQSLRQEGKAIVAVDAPVAIPRELYNQLIETHAPGSDLGDALRALVPAEAVMA